MFADILERCRDLFSTDRKDLEYLFRRRASGEDASWISDRELFGNLVKGDLTLVGMQKAMRSGSEDAVASSLLTHLRGRLLPRFPYNGGMREEHVRVLVTERDAASRTVAWAEQICQRTFYSLYGGTINMGPYLDWYTDLAGKSWFYEHVRGMRDKIFNEKIQDTLKMGPLRATWDLNALHHLVELGKAFWITGEERFAQQYVLQSLDWMEKNPPNMGINWTDELAVARRAVSWALAQRLFLDAAAVTPDFAIRSVKTLLMHGAYLADYLRRSREETRPAYRLAAATALYVIAVELPEFRSCARWSEIAEALLPAALEEEFGDDGAHRSGSIDLHRMSCELALLPHLLAAANGARLSPDTRALAEGAFQYLINVLEADGSYQPIGASWPERVLPFGPPFQSDLSGLVALAALTFEREDMRPSGRPGWTLAWLGGLDAPEKYRQYGRRFASEAHEARAYREAAVVVLREGWGEKDFWGMVRVVPPGSTGAVVHDDYMHVSAAVGGVRVLTDTGSLVLGDARARYFDSQAAHNVLVVRDAEPLPPSEGKPGGLMAMPDGRYWVHGGRRGWKRADGSGVVWHQRDLIFMPGAQTLSLMDTVEGDGVVDVEISFQAPGDLEIVQRGDLGCIFWKRVGLFRLHPYFPDTFRGSVERGREHGPPAWLCRDGVSVEPLQRIRYTSRLKLPCWVIFWMTWNVSGANTPSVEEARGQFASLSQGNGRAGSPAEERGRARRRS